MQRNVPKVTERELEIMELIWRNREMAAADIAAHFLKPENGGHFKNTTYTFIRRLLEKGVIARREPGFVCVPLYGRDEILISETRSFIDRVYNGSFNQLFAKFIENRALSEGELRELRALIDQAAKGGDGNA
ncbi:MAG: BlaI/MecI/CopY family transcriptional regulator [Syntrophomonadaceae bacterium]|nr:BlaI/MecI/CopY family transcriptional regulator [Syntrophomonadaceae bacterium]